MGFSGRSEKQLNGGSFHISKIERTFDLVWLFFVFFILQQGSAELLGLE